MKAKNIFAVFGILFVISVGLILSDYLAGYFYYFVNKSWPVDVSLETWPKYYHFYSDDVIQGKRLKIAAGLGLFSTFVLPFLIYLSTIQKGRSLHGDASFANISQIKKSGLMGDEGIIVGKYDNQYLQFAGQQSVLLIAPTRSGKGVSIVIPNLLNFPDSIVCFDIKSENFLYTSGFRAKHGQQVFLFSPFDDEGKGHRWNPFDLVSRSITKRSSDIAAIAQVFYPNGGGKDDKDGFWNDQARNLFLGLALYLLDTPEKPFTLGEILRQGTGDGRPARDYIQHLIRSRLDSGEPLSDECQSALNRFCAGSDNTIANIQASFLAPLTIFANVLVDAATSASDFDISQVRKQRMTIYVGIQPNRLGDARVLVNLFFSQLINHNLELPQKNKDLKYQCLTIFDEFTSIGRLAIIPQTIGFTAGYNMRLLTVCQSIAQLEATYGKEDTRTLTTNHALQIVFPPKEQKDANEYSEMLGYLTEKATSRGISRTRGWGGNGSTSENVSDQRRALMLPQELREMPQDQSILLLENTKPILCNKGFFYKNNVFINRLRGVSQYLSQLRTTVPNQNELEHAAFVESDLSSPVPVYDVALFTAKAEKRIRVLKDDEAIDLSKLAIDIPTIAPLDKSEASHEALTELVNDFFEQIGVDANQDTFSFEIKDEIAATQDDGGTIEWSGSTAFLPASLHPLNPSAIDLSVLDEN
ncbi:type IV secretory system conjugative DNA transfer family protein (plasmid) [Ampullimonas aquatilis]|uniref:type IV secretory system conjugative DNA transfer family protein n=1 Tax=Ampullimonas aquatilis TaxID=1341549 RepID=UPI003C74F645